MTSFWHLWASPLAGCLTRGPLRYGAAMLVGHFSPDACGFHCSFGACFSNSLRTRATELSTGTYENTGPRPDSDLPHWDPLRWAQKSVFNKPPGYFTTTLGGYFQLLFPWKGQPSFSNSKKPTVLSLFSGLQDKQAANASGWQSPGCNHVLGELYQSLRWGWEVLCGIPLGHWLNMKFWSGTGGFGRSSSTASLPLSSSIHSFICWAFID